MDNSMYTNTRRHKETRGDSRRHEETRGDTRRQQEDNRPEGWAGIRDNTTIEYGREYKNTTPYNPLGTDNTSTNIIPQLLYKVLRVHL